MMRSILRRLGRWLTPLVGARVDAFPSADVAVTGADGSLFSWVSGVAILMVQVDGVWLWCVRSGSLKSEGRHVRRDLALETAMEEAERLRKVAVQ